MAAYASLLSLGHILEHLLQHPPNQMAVFEKARIDSLLENITFLQDFLEEFSPTRGEEIIKSLEKKVARSAFAAEDIIERRVVDQILLFSKAERRWSGIYGHFNHLLNKMTLIPNVWWSSTLFSRDLQKVTEEFCSIKKDVMKIKETQGITILQQPREDATAGSFTRGASNKKSTMKFKH